MSLLPDAEIVHTACAQFVRMANHPEIPDGLLASEEV